MPLHSEKQRVRRSAYGVVRTLADLRGCMNTAPKSQPRDGPGGVNESNIQYYFTKA
jgi:hypothetical protein